MKVLELGTKLFLISDNKSQYEIVVDIESWNYDVSDVKWDDVNKQLVIIADRKE